MESEDPKVREARPGDEPGIHEAHMRSIREICIKDHGEEEVRGWGNRPLGSRWIQPIKEGYVWVVEFRNEIHGHGYVSVKSDNHGTKAEIQGLYLTPEVVGKGFGRRLAELMISKAKLQGATEITLDSSLTAHDFYKRMGFVDTGPLEYSDLGGSSVRGYPMVLKL